MGADRRRARWVSLVAINLAVLGVPLSAYFLIVFSTKYAYLESRSFRALNELGIQLTKRIVSFDGLFRFLPAADNELEAPQRPQDTGAAADRGGADRFDEPGGSGIAEWARERRQIDEDRARIERLESEIAEAKLRLAEEEGESERAEGTLRAIRLRHLRSDAEEPRGDSGRELPDASAGTLEHLSRLRRNEDSIALAFAESALRKIEETKTSLGRLMARRDGLEARIADARRRVGAQPTPAEDLILKSRDERRAEERRKGAAHLKALRRSYPSIRFEAAARDQTLACREAGRELQLDLDRGASQPVLTVVSCKVVDKLCISPEGEDTWRSGIDRPWCQRSWAVPGSRSEAHLKASVPLASLISSSQATRHFEQVLIASESGHVIYDSGGDFVQVSHLRDLVISPSEAARGSKETDGAPSAAGMSLGGHSQVIPITVGETQYLLFAQPYRPPGRWLDPMTGAGASPAWHLIGLIPQSEVRSAALEIPHTLLGTILILLLLGGLAWPYLKIILIGPRERLRPIDGQFLGLSVVLGTGLLAILVLCAQSFSHLEEEFDRTAKQIAKDLVTAFDAELDASLRELAGQAKQILDDTSEDPRPESWSVSPVAVVAPAEETRPRPASPPGSLAWAVYPPYEAIAVVDASGVQVGRQKTYRDAFAEKVEIPDREYFLRALSGPLWLRPRAEPDVPCQLFISRISTYDHGWKLSAISIPLAKVKGASEEGRDPTVFDPACKPVEVSQRHGDARVALMVKRFLTFSEPALPPGFGFAVVDADGGTLYHSDDTRSLVESFLLETDEHPGVRTAIESRHSDEFSARYNGKSHRLVLHPIQQLPWTLVVFYEKELTQLTYLDLVVPSVLQLLLYAGWIGAWVLGISALGPTGIWAWLWPAVRDVSRYHRRSFTLTVALGAFYATGLSVLRGPALNLLCLALPLTLVGSLAIGASKLPAMLRIWRVVLLVGAAMTLVVLAGAGPWWLNGIAYLGLGATVVGSSERARARLGVLRARFGSWSPSYLCVAMLVTLSLAVLPAWASFVSTERLASEKLTRLIQVQTAKGLERQDLWLQSDARRFRPGLFAVPQPPPVFRELEDAEQFSKRATSLSDVSAQASKDPSEAASSPLGFPITPRVIGPILQNMHAGIPSVGCIGTRTDDADSEAARLLREHGLAGWITLHLPQISPRGGELRMSGFERATDRHWVARTDVAGGPQVCLASRFLDGRQYLVKSSVLALLPGPLAWDVVPFAALALLAAVWAMLRSIARRVLGASLRPFAVLPLESSLRLGNLLLVRPGSDVVQRVIRSAAEQVGAENVEVVEGLGHPLARCGLARVIVVTQLDTWIDSPERRQSLLDELERAVRSERSVILCCETSPIYRIVAPRAYPEQPAASEEGSDVTRWTLLLSHFSKERFALPREDPSQDAGRSLARVTLDAECGWSEELRRVSQQIQALPGFEVLSESDVVRQVGDRAEAFYWRVWRTSTRDERLVLLDRAEGNLVNPENRDVLEHLIRRGLIRRAPSFELASESFRLFILGAEDPERVSEWRHQAADGTWDMVQVPLLLLLLMAVGFVLYASREALDITLGALPALVGAVPLLIRAVGALRGVTSGQLTRSE